MVSTSGNQKGGGYGSRQHVEGSVRVGSGSKSARPAGVAQIGLAWGRHVTRTGDSNYSGERLHNDRSFQPTKFGNEVAANTVCGVGRSRTIYSSGSQSGSGGHGSANPGNPQPKGRGILTNE
jgi:hypothetical protein